MEFLGSWGGEFLGRMNPAAGAPIVDDSYLAYITSLGLTSGLVMHLPLNETTGTVAADASGAGNDGTYTSGPTLGQAPLVAGFDYSILGPGYVVAPDTMADPAIDSITARFDFLASAISANTGLFGRLSGSQRFEVYLIPGGQIRFDFFDGANLARVTTVGTYDDGAAHSLCLRSDVFSQEIEMWIDGISVGSASTSAVSLTPGTTTDFRLNSSYLAPPGVVQYGGPTIWTTPLSDVNCALMAAGAV
jgi:hypothetical protein